MKKEKIWSWKFPSGKVYKVVSSPEKGTIMVYNPKGDVVQENKDMTPEQIKLIEENFLGTTTYETNQMKYPVESEEEKVRQYIR